MSDETRPQPPARRESLSERLARLRRQAPPTPKPPTGTQPIENSDDSSQGPGPSSASSIPPARALPIWVQRRLARGRTGSTTSRGATQPVGQGGAARRTVGPPSGLQEGDGFWFRRTVLPREHQHGEVLLHRARRAPRAAWAALCRDPELEKLDPESAVYLDTETTGLSGGAGIFVYMVGLARFVRVGPEPAVEVWQGFLQGPEQEAALLAEVARRIEASSGMVSFFGKSFDRHRLEDKMRMHGIEPPFESLPHLDLYHPLRRLHREHFPQHRLQTMEKALCAFEREDDLPGSLAPEAWFDFLGGRAHRLEGVFQHNLDDVLSLIALTDWLGRIEQRERRVGCPIEWEREGALAQAWAQAGQGERGLERLAMLLEVEQGPEALWLVRAQLEYRCGRFGDCVDSLQRGFPSVWDHPQERATVARVEALALWSKVLEHKLRDRTSAWRLSQRACEMLGQLRPFRGRGPLEKEVRLRCGRLAPPASTDRDEA